MEEKKGRVTHRLTHKDHSFSAVFSHCSYELVKGLFQYFTPLKAKGTRTVVIVVVVEFVT